MVSNVSGNNLGVLLKQKQNKLDSINKQKDAVQIGRASCRERV